MERVSTSTGWLRLFGALLCALVCAPSAHAIGRPRYVDFRLTPDSFRLVYDGVAAPILLDSQDYPGVLRAARDLQTDIERVTQIQPRVLNDETPRAVGVVVVSTLGKSRLIEELGGPRSYKWLNTIPITKVWEQMHLAYRRGANRIWIVNVGDIKPLEFPPNFF